MIFEDYLYEKVYDCSPLTKCKNFTKLMVLVMNTEKNPELNKDIFLYKDIINETNEFGWTALMLACRNSNSIETVQILLDCGANVDATQTAKVTALMMACVNENSKVVKLLLDCGANINLKNIYGKTALIYASSTNNIDCVKLLLDYGANVEMTNNKHESAYVIAVNNDISSLILKYSTLRYVCITEDRENEVLDRIKIERYKCKMYERCLKYIPEQDAIIRYKKGNMGYKISMYQYNIDITNEETNEIMCYLSATSSNLSQKIEEYMNINI